MRRQLQPAHLAGLVSDVSDVLAYQLLSMFNEFDGIGRSNGSERAMETVSEDSEHGPGRTKRKWHRTHVVPNNVQRSRRAKRCR